MVPNLFKTIKTDLSNQFAKLEDPRPGLSCFFFEYLDVTAIMNTLLKKKLAQIRFLVLPGLSCLMSTSLVSFYGFRGQGGISACQAWRLANPWPVETSLNKLKPALKLLRLV